MCSCFTPPQNIAGSEECMMATVLGYVLEYAAFANLKYRTLWYKVQGDPREKFSGISNVFLVSG